eukprot:10737143-Lingulodinium_polyedra.AAC.1
MAFDREATERFPNCRMDRTRVDRGAGVGSDLEPSGTTGGQQEVVKPKGLFGSDYKPNEVINVRGPLRGLDNRV